MAAALAPPLDCGLCPRLVAYRAANRRKEPSWHNAPVASFGPLEADLLIVGLAPGRRGANRTARPFTGDFAGDLLYATLVTHGFATGSYAARADDGLELRNCRITNAVRCVPPENKPTGAEAAACRPFLRAEFDAMEGLSVVLALGTVAHQAVLAALGRVRAAQRFGHGATHEIGAGRLLVDSYHCSRLNTNTGRLTEAMFHAIFDKIRAHLEG